MCVYVCVYKDLDLVRFIITCLSTYFPGILAYLLLFEMPWLLSCMFVLCTSCSFTLGFTSLCSSFTFGFTSLYRGYCRLSWVPEGLGLVRRTLEDCWSVVYRLDVLLAVTLPSLSKHWKQRPCTLFLLLVS